MAKNDLLGYKSANFSYLIDLILVIVQLCHLQVQIGNMTFAKNR